MVVTGGDVGIGGFPESPCDAAATFADPMRVAMHAAAMMKDLRMPFSFLVRSFWLRGWVGVASSRSGFPAPSTLTAVLQPCLLPIVVPSAFHQGPKALVFVHHESSAATSVRRTRRRCRPTVAGSNVLLASPYR